MDEEIMEEITDDSEEEIPEFYFSNPDPYYELPHDQRKHSAAYFGEDGHLHVRNPSAYWLPELTVRKEIGNTVYVVTGSYDGTESLDKKLLRIMEQSAENDGGSQ